jgi:hypothetical protein
MLGFYQAYAALCLMGAPTVMRFRFLAVFAAAGLAAQTPLPNSVHLVAGAPIYVSDGEPESVRRAALDLQRDLHVVMGENSPVLNRLDPRLAGMVITGGASSFAELRDPAISGREAHGVFVRGRYVVLQGADTRGAIYAVYTFSERYLGVPPLWYWSSWKPVPKQSVDVPAATHLYFPPPYVHWRAWFPNDQDLLTPWKERSQENYEAIVETMLRLKMNAFEGEMMDRGSFDRPYQIGREFRLVRDRGLAVTGHHMRIFGSNYEHWDLYWHKIRNQEPPPLTIANVQALEDFWRYHVEMGIRQKLEMIWLIGFRGKNDNPFWQLFPDAPATDAARANVIQNMMFREVALLKATTGNPAPVMRVTLYNENSDLFAQGLLHPPDDPTLIWTFVAARRDHFPAADIRALHNDRQQPIGYYFNFQFTSSGAHLAQAEGPWKMEKNYRMVNAISGRPLEFSVVNAGNIREFLLGLSANARMLWDFEGYRTDSFLRDFCAQHFGAEHAESVAALYRDFYNSYWTQKKPDLAGFDRQYVFQDMRYARAMEQILAQLPKGRDLNPLSEARMDKNGGYFRIVAEDSGASSQIEAIVKGTTASISKLTSVVERADAELPSLPAGDREFFNDNLRTQARFMLGLNQALRAVAQAMECLPDKNAAAASLQKAASDLTAMRTTLQEAEHSRFTGWYDSDRLFGLDKLNERVRNSIRDLR